MAKKLKKQKKGMSPKAKFILASSFKGLISNQACIDGSHEAPWWVASIFLVFSVVIPLLPNLFRLGAVNGGSFLTSGTFGLDKQMTQIAYDLKTEGVDLKVENGLLHYYQDGIENPNGFVNPYDEVNYFTDTVIHQERVYESSAEPHTELRVFFWNLKGDTLKKAVNTITAQRILQGTAGTITNVKEDKKYIPNIIIFTPQTFAIALYKYNTTTQVSTSQGGLDWSNTGKTGLITRMLNKSIKDGVWADNVPSMEAVEFVNTYSIQTYKVLVAIANETYLHQRTINQWSTTGIYAGIYAGVIVFLGLMVFVLTRGKNNPFKYLNVWHCQKIAWWASAAPAIIGAILSLVFGTNAIGQIAFVLVVSLRIMWLSMKQLRPVYQAQ